MGHVFAYITAKDLAEAEKIGQVLVGERLAACVNILDGMLSMYWWQGQLEKSKEVVIIAKTREELKESLLERVKEIHSYDCPCVIFLPVQGGNKEFLDWINAETQN
ncbi:divalent-cation tolerance protein CutA [Desulfohalobiaceae bacterium Ax17]|uniref:divalent-cation tolerance protein CutA n=1 Tax=Desulfovulcanus ferrireducens TaxID=2831190 RepID=UPI00207BAC6D|nr:divalent-cation tolerance protein CutA [Desulfovulcanus ferrireducens]MBT8763024.1 divalent-cation tolerance protein CutA [Desulfovulcanus ferrireducens]